MSEKKAHLVVLNPDGQTSEYPLSKHDVVLGRSDACDVQLIDRSVSREHARISLKKGVWGIRDLRSVNGTYVDGKAVTQETLQSGCEITLGVYRLRFVSAVEACKISESAASKEEFELTTRVVVLDEEIPAELREIASAKNVSLETIAGRNPLERIVGSTGRIRKVRELISKAARSETPVLVRGETGTGKELVAQAIARLSRNRRPYAVIVNLAAMGQSLASAELFGHERGAFTGADRARKGMIELADGATLFLDEVGNAPAEVQGMLLRVLDTGEVRTIGGRKVKHVNVRVVAATNRDLQRMMEQGQFSDALYYRLSQFEIYLPPLRERKEDVLLLARHFLAAAARSCGVPMPELSDDVAAALCGYGWPGNVRELKGCMEYAVAVLESRKITVSCLPPRVRGEQQAAAESVTGDMFGAARRALVVDALRQAGDNKSQAARILGVSRQAVYQMIKRFGIDEKEWQ